MNDGILAAAHPCDIVKGSYETWKSSAEEVGVVIVGGGVAGLTAAKTLIENDYTNLLILEADNRIGGRVRTIREGSVLVEEGAEWIHGGSRNPLFKIAKSLKAVARNRPNSSWDWRVRTNQGDPGNAGKFNRLENLIEKTEKNGILRPYYDDSYGQFFVDRYPRAYGNGWNNTLGRAWFHFLEKLVNSDEGSYDWLDISARDADKYVDYGTDRNWKNGYDTLIDYLEDSIPNNVIRKSTPVCKIFWDSLENDKVLLVTNGGNYSYMANFVIFTASVGHLKERHNQLFQPSLPSSVIKNLNGIELGLADKIQIGWSEPWWGTQNPLDLLILWSEFKLPKDMEWLYGVVEAFSIHQQTNVLQMFVTGSDATQMEELPQETVKQHVRQLLSEATGLQVPEPSFFRRSQWGLNPWTRGSFSSYITLAGNEGGLRRRKQLAVPLKNSKGSKVLLWAGEHTHNTRYSTVDGALSSGKREAKKLLRIMKRKM
ncbi:hypothetical protein SK128_020192 [Halocaridina rubra]|uniref:Amine oxidase n=1 Tax=Halocaridina rubra TaxID=373956 RepID=A0AAN8XCJ5_HALRR